MIKILHTVNTALLLMALALHAFGDEKLSTTWAFDTSKSVASQSMEMKKELKDAINALPDGTHCTLLAVGGTVRRLFDGDLNPTRRAELLSQIDGLAFNALNSDLGGGLAEAAFGMAAQPGRKEIWIFTDGENRPMPKSRQRGQSFAQVLSETALPPGIEVNVRLFGNAYPELNSEQAKILRSAPDWKALFTPPPPPPPPPVPNPDRWVWRAGYIVLGLGFAATVLAWYKLSGKAEARMRQPLAVPMPEPQAAPASALRFTVETAAGERVGGLSADGTTELRIGDSPLADLLYPEAAGSLVRLRVIRTRDAEQLELSNEGTIPVHIGSLAVAPRRQQILPLDLIEIKLGGLFLRVFPEAIPATEMKYV